MLGNMEQLRGTLGISRLENVSNVIVALQALLNKKKDVKKLHLRWNTTADETVAFFVLKGLELHTDLKELQIYGYGGRNFPIWIGDPSFYNLAHITFFGFERSVSLPYLGQLPNHKLLSLHKLSRLAQIDADVMSGLIFLDTLTISDMPNLTVWNGPHEGHCPMLRVIKISICPRLSNLLEFSLFAVSLKQLYMENCNVLPITLDSLYIEQCMILNQSCQVGGEDRNKIEHIRHVFII